MIRKRKGKVLEALLENFSKAILMIKKEEGFMMETGDLLILERVQCRPLKDTTFVTHLLPIQPGEISNTVKRLYPSCSHLNSPATSCFMSLIWPSAILPVARHQMDMIGRAASCPVFFLFSDGKRRWAEPIQSKLRKNPRKYVHICS